LASEIEMIKQKNTMLREACNIRAVRMGPPVFEYGAQQRGVESPVLSDQGELYWPLLLLYDESAQTDFIQQVSEGHTLLDQLGMVFPALTNNQAPPIPWDEERKYFLEYVEVWFEVNQVPAFDPKRSWDEPALRRDVKPITRKQALVGSATPKWAKVPLTCTLGEVLSSPQYVVPQIPVVHVVSRGNHGRASNGSDKFYRKWKEGMDVVRFVPGK
jgi:hypothetical protein